MKINRNDPCHCGSGKKYKKCCLNQEELSSTQIVDFAWYKLRKMEGEVIDNYLLPFLEEMFEESPIINAFNKFVPNDIPDTLDKEIIFKECFIPWLFFNWIPQEEFDPHKNEEAINLNCTIAQNFLMKHYNDAPKPVIKFIEAMNETYYSFYTIEEVVIDKSLKIKDFLLGYEHIVKEKSATHTLKAGDMVCGRILSMENQSIFVGMIPFIIPKQCYKNIIEYKEFFDQEPDEEIRIETIQELSCSEIVNFCFKMNAEYYDRPMPELRNTDGDRMLFTASFFNLKISPYNAFKKLLPLTLSRNEEEFIHEAKYDKSGEIVEISFPWLKKKNKLHKSWDNTVMGDVFIKKDKLCLKTNSLNRAEVGKKLLIKYLKDEIEFEGRSLESIDQKLDAISKNDEITDLEDDFLNSPEILEHLERITQEYWNDWFNQKIPDLEYKTPKEAMKSENGRVMLEALLNSYENRNKEIKDKKNVFQVDVQFLRKTLGLCDKE